MDSCENCGEPNPWRLMGDQYELICFECSESVDTDVDDEGVYRKLVRCRGCETWGAPNYEDDKYYCGTSPWCVP